MQYKEKGRQEKVTRCDKGKEGDKRTIIDALKGRGEKKGSQGV